MQSSGGLPGQAAPTHGGRCPEQCTALPWGRWAEPPTCYARIKARKCLLYQKNDIFPWPLVNPWTLEVSLRKPAGRFQSPITENSLSPLSNITAATSVMQKAPRHNSDMCQCETPQNTGGIAQHEELLPILTDVPLGMGQPLPRQKPTPAVSHQDHLSSHLHYAWSQTWVLPKKNEPESRTSSSMLPHRNTNTRTKGGFLLKMRFGGWHNHISSQIPVVIAR